MGRVDSMVGGSGSGDTGRAISRRSSARSGRGHSWWIAGVVIVVMVVSAVYVGRLRLSEIPDRAIGHAPAAPQAGVPGEKSIEYAVTGPSGSTARVSYLVPGGRTVDETVRVPWRMILRSRELTTAAGVLTQARGQRSVSCSVRVNGFERSRQVGAGADGSSVANCLVPVA
ncbi:MmpS family transport accessory protein [Gordonia sp. CPCC 205333]|uniref:MmpS family transport accessory protein n=1 Tax=Gordonia sp. CPCC 205333 TaxID=3140790 RepID=UPI003AF3A2FE